MSTRLIGTKVLVNINGKEIVVDSVYITTSSRTPAQVDLVQFPFVADSLKPELNYEDDDISDEYGIEYGDCYD